MIGLRPSRSRISDRAPSDPKLLPMLREAIGLTVLESERAVESAGHRAFPSASKPPGPSITRKEKPRRAREIQNFRGTRRDFLAKLWQLVLSGNSFRVIWNLS